MTVRTSNSALATLEDRLRFAAASLQIRLKKKSPGHAMVSCFPSYFGCYLISWEALGGEK